MESDADDPTVALAEAWSDNEAVAAKLPLGVAASLSDADA
jgi:hypothetical protein